MTKVIMLGLIGASLFAHPIKAQGDVEWGYASGYADTVMEGVVMNRYQNDIWRVRPPRDYHDVDFYIAAMDCARVGEVATVYDPDGGAHSALIADCAGADGDIDRFSSKVIILELDYTTWAAWTTRWGTPLEVGLR